MTIVNHKVAAQSDSSEVVDTTCSVGDIAHDNCLDATKLFQDVRDSASENQQSLGELKCNYIAVSIREFSSLLVQT
jgi:hypothetical protein